MSNENEGPIFLCNVPRSPLFKLISDHLKQEIIMQSSRGLLDNAKLFYNVSRTLVGNIITSLKSDICLDEDVIYVAGSQGDCMYFVISGTVALISFFGKEICHLQDGDHFGEIALIYPDRQRDVSAIACEVCELLRFDRRDFNRLVPPNSLLFTRLEKIAQARLATVVQVNKLTKEAERRKRKEDIQNSEQTTSL